MPILVCEALLTDRGADGRGRDRVPASAISGPTGLRGHVGLLETTQGCQAQECNHGNNQGSVPHASSVSIYPNRHTWLCVLAGPILHLCTVRLLARMDARRPLRRYQGSEDTDTDGLQAIYRGGGGGGGGREAVGRETSDMVHRLDGKAHKHRTAKTR